MLTNCVVDRDNDLHMSHIWHPLSLVLRHPVQLHSRTRVDARKSFSTLHIHIRGHSCQRPCCCCLLNDILPTKTYCQRQDLSRRQAAHDACGWCPVTYRTVLVRLVVVAKRQLGPTGARLFLHRRRHRFCLPIRHRIYHRPLPQFGSFSTCCEYVF